MYLCRDLHIEAFHGVQARADSSAALRQLVQAGQRLLHAQNAVLDLLRIQRERDTQ